LLKLDPRDIRGAADLEALPILTKGEVQAQGVAMQSEAVPAAQRVTAHTSGTTGAGLRFATTHAALAEQWAVWWRYRRWHGIGLDTWCALFTGRSIVPLTQPGPPFWRYNVPGRQIMFSGYHMTPERLVHYANALRRRRPPWLHGYPSLIALLAGHLIDSATDLGYQPRWITLGSESLLPHQAGIIERAFGVRPRQHYGLTEAVANISEWTDGTLRIDEEFSVVELLPQAGGLHRIVGTSLSNLATPLLRYDTGDLASVSSDTDAGVVGGRAVTAVDGRKEDYIVLRNGARLGRMDHVFKDMTAVREAQLYQREAGVIEVRLVKREHYTNEDEARLLYEFRKRVGDDTELRLDYRESLPRTGNGKLRFVVSEIPGEGAQGGAG
jgi:phenylacetate-CoA ligase